MTVEELIAEINKLTVLQLVELKDALKEAWGVEAAAPVAVAAAAGPAAAAVEEEKDSFTVKITGVTGNKIQVIKVVRELTNLGLKEAKELVESAPNAVVAEDILKPEAEAMKAKLEESGATVELA
ncbi:MAG: 50S ribosomal protein L7/L12 [candidate division WS1 bacterium]|nr:50S ribosomal protein L7/L12 [candidate division WS1 bacterium]